MYDARDWYWIVAGSTTQVWSSKRVGYFPVDDATYQSWLSAGGVATKIDSATSLVEVLLDQWAPFVLNVGVALTSTATPALNATYSLSVDAQSEIAEIADGISNGKGLPGNGATFNYPDIYGNPHAFDSAQWLNAAAAFRDYIYAFKQAIETLVSGGSATVPVAAVTIA